MPDITPNSPALNPHSPPPPFTAEVRAMVNETAPSRFALISEYVTDDGEPDAFVAGWGLADRDDGTVLVTSTGARRTVHAQSAERAALLLGRLTGGPIRLEWLDAAPVIA
jgi:hypothetical protein